jgi:hypothetical protein
MPSNEIFAEIYRHREEFARDCGFDLQEMFRPIRSNERELEADGWKFVTPSEVEHEVSCILREEPPKLWKCKPTS